MKTSDHHSSKVWAAEYRDKGIRAYGILPDATESAMRKSGFHVHNGMQVQNLK